MSDIFIYFIIGATMGFLFYRLFRLIKRIYSDKKFFQNMDSRIESAKTSEELNSLHQELIHRYHST